MITLLWIFPNFRSSCQLSFGRDGSGERGVRRGEDGERGGRGDGETYNPKSKISLLLTPRSHLQPLAHLLDKLTKQVVGIMRAGTGFGVILNGETGKSFML